MELLKSVPPQEAQILISELILYGYLILIVLQVYRTTLCTEEISNPQSMDCYRARAHWQLGHTNGRKAQEAPFVQVICACAKPSPPLPLDPEKVVDCCCTPQDILISSL